MQRGALDLRQQQRTEPQESAADDDPRGIEDVDQVRENLADERPPLRIIWVA